MPGEPGLFKKQISLIDRLTDWANIAMRQEEIQRKKVHELCYSTDDPETFYVKLARYFFAKIKTEDRLMEQQQFKRQLPQLLTRLYKIRELSTDIRIEEKYKSLANQVVKACNSFLFVVVNDQKYFLSVSQSVAKKERSKRTDFERNIVDRRAGKSLSKETKDNLLFLKECQKKTRIIEYKIVMPHVNLEELEEFQAIKTYNEEKLAPNNGCFGFLLNTALKASKHQIFNDIITHLAELTLQSQVKALQGIINTKDPSSNALYQKRHGFFDWLFRCTQHVPTSITLLDRLCQRLATLQRPKEECFDSPALYPRSEFEIEMEERGNFLPIPSR